MKKKAVLGFIITAAAVLVIFWFSGVLPKEVAKLTAIIYVEKNSNGMEYEIKGVEYSPAYDYYFVYLNNVFAPAEKVRSIGVIYRYFPFFIISDSESWEHIKQ